MAGEPSKTINRLHFTDLGAGRFEDLCLALIFPLHPWADIRHYGRSGTDQGVDIHAKERLDGGLEREWFVQCRRYASATKATLIAAVDDALEHATKPPEVLLVVVASDASRTAHEAYSAYAASKGVGTPLLWTASVLEARLYGERRDLLFAYFGVSAAAEARAKETAIVRNIALKKRLRRELRKDARDMEPEAIRRRPPEKFAHSEFIIHSMDDSSYPDVDTTKRTGISGWFKLEIWDFYYNGLEFIIGIDDGIADEHGRWCRMKSGSPRPDSTYKPISMYRLGQIPYANIVEVDLDGDEFYPQPHLYCRFASGGQPYEGFRHVLIGDYPWPLEPDKEFQLTGSAEPSNERKQSRATEQPEAPASRLRRRRKKRS